MATHAARAARPELVVADDVAGAALAVILEARPRTWALAGGETPRGLYRRLVDAPLDWRAIEVFFGDERCVPPDHAASNFRMAYEALLAHVPARVHRMRGEDCDAEGYEALLRERLGPRPALDLALLGLGRDGHTASLFPGSPVLDERERLVVRVTPPADADPPVARLTLTLPVLSDSVLALFLVSGEAKREPLRALLEGAPIPASMVRAQRVVVVADPAAAGRPALG